MNSIKLKGTLGSDPKFKFFNSGAGICEFSIAEYNGKYKASDKIPTGKAVGDKKTLWHNIKMWAKDIDPQIVKGVEVEITGRLDVEIFTNKDGVEVNKPVIYIDVDSITGIQSIKISEWYATKNGIKTSLVAGQDLDNISTDDIPF